MVQQICLPSLISPFPSLQSVINPHTLKYPNCQKAHKSLCIPISAPGISVGGGANQLQTKPKTKTKTKQNKTNPKSKNKNPKFPNWKKITNPLTKKTKQQKKIQLKKKKRKTLNTQIGKKLTQINNKPRN